LGAPVKYESGSGGRGSQGGGVWCTTDITVIKMRGIDWRNSTGPVCERVSSEPCDTLGAPVRFVSGGWVNQAYEQVWWELLVRYLKRHMSWPFPSSPFPSSPFPSPPFPSPPFPSPPFPSPPLPSPPLPSPPLPSSPPVFLLLRRVGVERVQVGLQSQRDKPATSEATRIWRLPWNELWSPRPLSSCQPSSHIKYYYEAPKKIVG
ncbi:unnamed protein product, partial [Closterium sp. NIES-65]